MDGLQQAVSNPKGGNTSTTKGSDEIFEMHCELCKRDGTKVISIAFCTDCYTYLCSTCLKYHGKFLPDHKCLEKDKLPLDICTETCEKHRGEFIKFFCNACSNFACSICKIEDHKATCALKYLPEVVKDIGKGEDLKELSVSAGKLSTKLQETNRKIDENHVQHRIIVEGLRDAIKLEKDAVFAKFDEEALEIEKQTESLKKTEAQPVDSLRQKLANLNTDIAELSNKAKEMPNTERSQKYKIFIQIKQKRHLLRELEDAARNLKLGRDTTTGKIGLLRDDLKQKLKTCGEKMQESARQEIEREKMAHFEMAIDFSTCNFEYVSRIVNVCLFSDQYLVACDGSNSTILLVDLISREVVFSRRVYTYPRATTKVKDTRIAIVRSDKSNKGKSIIQFLSLKSRKLAFQKRSFMIDMFCVDIAYITGDRLVVVGSRKVQVLDMAGELQATIEKDKAGNNLFSEPNNITADPEGKHVYVSDWYTDSITEIDMTNHISRKLDQRLWHPQGITVGKEGNIYVCESGTKHIVLVHPGRLHSEILVDNGSGPWRPLSICYSAAEEKLYVCQDGTDLIHVYKVTQNKLSKNDNMDG